jgi:hypothetical protein
LDGLGRYLNKATEVLKITPAAGSQLRDERRKNHRTKIGKESIRAAENQRDLPIGDLRRSFASRS